MNDKINKMYSVKKFTPYILKCSKKTGTIIYNIITLYTHKEQTKIIAPAFTKIADQFFSVLDDAIDLGTRLNAKEYDFIVSLVMENETYSLEEKIDLIAQFKNKTTRQNIENVLRILNAGGKYVLGTTAIVTLGILSKKLNEKGY